MIANNRESGPRDGRTPSRSRRGTRGLLASFLALTASLVLAVGASAAGVVAGAGESSAGATGGSVIGVLVDNSPSHEDPNLVANGSYLSILLASAQSGNVTVTFLLEKPAEGEDGRVYLTEEVGRGAAVPEPTGPVWPAAEGGTADFAFDAWCAEDGSVWDFSTPVTADLRLYATWIAKEPGREEVSVTFKGCGGTMKDADGQDAGELTVPRLPGSRYPLPADPVRAGYAFRGWYTAETGGERVTSADSVGDADEVLYAQWEAVAYRVCYHENHGARPLSYTWPAAVEYDGTDVLFAGWEEVREQGGFTKPDGMDLSGWCSTKDGTGERHKIGDPVVNLTDVDGAVVDLYAVWEKDGTVEDGPFDVVFLMNDGTGGVCKEFLKDGEGNGGIPKYGRVPAFDDPKRPGYQFAGWYADEALTERWSFDEQVTEDTTLRAKWDLRLDVTVPVSVGFAVDADTGEATGPDEGRYALKSRTVAEVVVEEAALESRQEELEGFFELRDGVADASGGGAEAAAGEADDAWAAALADTRLSLGAGGVTVALPFAGESATVDDAVVWDSSRILADVEKAAFRMDAFAYGGTPADEAWQGGIPCKTLPLKLDLTIPVDQLKVKTAVDGPQKVTRLILTVSAQARGGR